MAKERITFIDAPNIPAKKILREVEKAEAQNEKVNKLLRVVEGKIELKVNFPGAIRLLPISDTHLFAPETDRKKVDEILGMLDEENTFGVICGDFIEGVHLRIHAGKSTYTFGAQIYLAKERIRPYVENGSLLGLVGWFDGHEGWAEKQATIEAIRFMKEGLYQPDGTPLQAVFNGGLLKVNLSNGEKFILKTFHDAGSGGSDEINPVGSQRKSAWAYKLNSPNRVDGVVAGHQHHRAGTAVEQTYNKLTGEETSQVLIALGTTKGNDDDHADSFLVAQAKGPTHPPGGSIIINQRKSQARSHDNVWASYGYDKGGILYEAAKIWEKTEKQKVTSEVVEKILKREGSPTVVFDRRNTRTWTKEDESKTPLFETFRWRVSDGKIPALVLTLAHARYGSTSGERERSKLLDILKQTENDPFKFSLIMGNFVDRDAPYDFGREAILGQMANDLKGVHDSNSLLGVMLSSVLRKDRWIKDVSNSYNYYDRANRTWKTMRDIRSGFYPGDYLYKKSSIAKTPLYLNDSIMFLRLGKIEYSFYLLDHLSWSGSEFDMFRGLVQAQRKGRLAIDIVAGGNMPGAGVMTTPDGVFVAPGWFSDYDSRGKANVKRAPMGGQGVILFPDKKLVIPASTFLEATDMHTALMLNAGLSDYEKRRIKR